MEIAFENIDLRNICEDNEYAIDIFGPGVAGILKIRLADLRAATSIEDLFIWHPHELNGYLAIDLIENIKIFISANHTKNPKLEDGKLDWTKINRIKIMNVGRNESKE